MSNVFAFKKVCLFFFKAEDVGPGEAITLLEHPPEAVSMMQQEEIASLPKDVISTLPDEVVLAASHVIASASQDEVSTVEHITMSLTSQETMPSLIEEVVCTVPQEVILNQDLATAEPNVVLSTTLNDSLNDHVESTSELMISEVKSQASVCADDEFEGQIIIIQTNEPTEKQVANTEESMVGGKQIMFELGEAPLYGEHHVDTEHMQVMSVNEHGDTVDFETNPDGSVKHVEIMAMNKHNEHAGGVYEDPPPGVSTEQVLVKI